MRRALAFTFIASLAFGPPAVRPSLALATHVGCGDTITANVTLDSDIGDCPGTALFIGADGVTLDLGGHVVGSLDLDRVGIDNRAGHDRVAIENGTVRGFVTNIALNGASDNQLRNVELLDAGSDAVRLVDSHQNVLQAVLVTNGPRFSDGIVLERSAGNRIEQNTATGGFRGIILFDRSDGNRIEDNVVTGGSWGVQVGTDRNYIRRNSVSDVVNFGIALGGSENRIEKNSSSGNGGGVSVSGSHNIVRQNVASGNRFQGIGVVGTGVGNRVKRNVAAENGLDGFLLEGAVAEGNVANSNGDDGIEAISGVLRRNTANDNFDKGIEASPAVIDGGGNRASGNGYPPQCVNVACR